MRQIDFLTRGLNEVVETQATKGGAAGGTTGKGRTIGNLSRDLRALVKEAVPDYKEALSLASHPIQARKAMELGQDVFLPSMTMDKFKHALADFPEGEMTRKYVAQGVRDRIDQIMARAKDSLIPAPSAAGRVSKSAEADIEAVRLLKEMSSRDIRTKVRAVVGDEEADKLFGKLDLAIEQFEVKNTQLQNINKAMEDVVDASQRTYEAGPMSAFRRGEFVESGKRAAAAFMGRGAEDVANLPHPTAQALVETLLSPANPKRLTALSRTPDPKIAGRNMSRLVEILAGRSPLAASPHLPQANVDFRR